MNTLVDRGQGDRDLASGLARARHTTAEKHGRAAVRFTYPRCVDAQGRRTSSAVAEPAGDGSQIDSSNQQLGR